MLFCSCSIFSGNYHQESCTAITAVCSWTKPFSRYFYQYQNFLWHSITLCKYIGDKNVTACNSEMCQILQNY